MFLVHNQLVILSAAEPSYARPMIAFSAEFYVCVVFVNSVLLLIATTEVVDLFLICHLRDFTALRLYRTDAGRTIISTNLRFSRDDVRNSAWIYDFLCSTWEIQSLGLAGQFLAWRYSESFNDCPCQNTRISIFRLVTWSTRQASWSGSVLLAAYALKFSCIAGHFFSYRTSYFHWILWIFSLCFPFVELLLQWLVRQIRKRQLQTSRCSTCP